jgi:hypothetical protein
MSLLCSAFPIISYTSISFYLNFSFVRSQAQLYSIVKNLSQECFSLLQISPKGSSAQMINICFFSLLSLFAMKLNFITPFDYKDKGNR